MKSALRVAVPLLVSIGSLEAMSFVSGSLILGRAFVGNAREERSRAISAVTPDLVGQGQPHVPQSIDFYALHPYLGFVADPASRTGPVRDANGTIESTDLGFFRRTRDADPSAEPPLRVAVFGGSVAFLFAFTVDDRLETLLANGRKVVVEIFAVPGFKQPQQLFALEYLMLLGERFDLVLNLDGFNEIALPVTENVPQGTAAIYPRSWGHLVGAVPGPTALQAAARLTVLRAARRASAEALSWPGLSWSATGAIVWQLSEALLRPRITAAETELARTSVGSSYATTGPRDAGESESRLDRMVEIWRRSSLLMHQVCEANGIAYVHVLQPNQYVPDAKPLGDAERAVAYREGSPYRAAVEMGYPRLIAAGEELRASGVRFVDASRAFAGMDEQLYVDDCCHFNRSGSKVLAEHVVPALQEALR